MYADKIEILLKPAKWLNGYAMQASLCVLPDGKLWGKLNALRVHGQDKGFIRWPPHIRLTHRNLMDISDDQIDRIEASVRGAACHCRTGFEVRGAG